MTPNRPIQAPRPMQIKLSADETMIIGMLREKKHQEVLVKVQDGAIVYVERTEKFRRTKGTLKH
jgi:hypothetical protein